MTTRHPFTPVPGMDYAKLRAKLAERLGFPVETLTSEPVDGPGVLIVEDPKTGEHLDIDPELVAAVLAEITTAPVRSSEERALAEMQAARTVVEKVAALEDYFGRTVAVAATHRAVAREMRRDIARRAAREAAELRRPP